VLLLGDERRVCREACNVGIPYTTPEQEQSNSLIGHKRVPLARFMRPKSDGAGCWLLLDANLAELALRVAACGSQPPLHDSPASPEHRERQEA
jgi:hypothetical protein